jgi:putative DNA modification/repair radical SAM protein
MVLVAETLREQHRFGGYIHLKGIPGAGPDLIRRAGLVADRLSVNIELPSEKALQDLAPDKNREGILVPMRQIGETIADSRRERKKSRKAPVFAPAGQSTQLIVGASPEDDLRILRLSQSLYRHYSLKRVYYSAYIPVNADRRLPAPARPPRMREHRLYQADWLLRYYGFKAEEILLPEQPHLEEEFDPKTAWALRNPMVFPVEINKVDYECLLRVPGIGVRSAKRIVAARRYGALDFEDLGKIGVVLKRARFFITCRGKPGVPLLSQDPFHYRQAVDSLRHPGNSAQLRLF